MLFTFDRSMKFPAMTVCPVRDSRWIGVLRMMKRNDPTGAGAIKVFEKLETQNKEKFLAIVLEMVKKRTHLYRFGKIKWVKDALKLIYYNDDIRGLANLYLDLYNTESADSGSFIFIADHVGCMSTAFFSNFAAMLKVQSWKLKALHFRAQGKTANETFEAISLLENAATNVSGFVVGNVKWRRKDDFLDFYYFAKFVENYEKFVSPEDFQDFIVDLITNKDKFTAQLGGIEWSFVTEYIHNVTSVQVTDPLSLS